MDDEQKEMFQRLIDVIGNHSNWNGKTNRELRDQVANSASEVATLRKQMVESTHSLVLNIRDLTGAINTHASSNNKVSRWMVILTIVLTASTVAMALATVVMAIQAFR